MYHKYYIKNEYAVVVMALIQCNVKGFYTHVTHTVVDIYNVYTAYI